MNYLLDRWSLLNYYYDSGVNLQGEDQILFKFNNYL